MLAIGLLVLLHEGGHFFFAKLFGVRVDKFYLFFDPSIWKWDGSLFKWKPKNSDTQYGVGWLPLGGYCKIAGMIDESFDTEQMKQPEQPWEFRAKPTWQRLLIMIGGVLVNFLPCEAHVATLADYDWRCARQLPPRPVYLFDDSLPLGRYLYPREGYDDGYEVQHRG